jgi:aconitase A
MYNELGTLRELAGRAGRNYNFHSLPALQEHGYGDLSRLPVSIRVVLESLVRNCDGKTVTKQDVKTLANWNAAKPSAAFGGSCRHALCDGCFGAESAVDRTAGSSGFGG